MKNNAKNINALKNILSDTSSRIIAIYYDTNRTATYIENFIKKNFYSSGIEKINLSSIPDHKRFFQLKKYIDNTDTELLLIYGLEKVGFEFSKDQQRFIPTDFLLQLNLDREKFFSSRKGKIIFMVPKSYRAYLKMDLADFWDWIFYHIEFNKADFEGGPSWKIENKGNKVGNLANKFLANKEKIKKLEKEIKSLKRNKGNDQLLKKKLNEIIDLYMSIGQLSVAKKWIDDFTFLLIEKKQMKELFNFFDKLVDYYLKKNLIAEALKYQEKLLDIIKKQPTFKEKDIEKVQNTLNKILDRKRIP